MKEEMDELRRQRTEYRGHLQTMKEEMETGLSSQRTEHEEQLKNIKEEMGELTRQRIEREERLNTIKEEMEEGLGSRRIELEQPQRTAEEQMERKIGLIFRDYRALWEKNQAQTLLRTA